MATVTATDFLVATGTPGLWVRLHNNVSGTDYYSTAVSDPQGAFTYTVPTGEYSLYVGSAATVPGTPTLRNGHFQVAVRNGDDAALNSGTFQSTGPYTPTAVAGGEDFSGAVRIAGGRPWFDPTHPTYGAKGDARTVTDAAITNGQPTLTSATAGFTAADTGKVFGVVGAGAAGIALVATGTFVNSTTITLSVNAGTTVTGAFCIYGTDDTTALKAVANAGPGIVKLPPLGFIATTTIYVGTKQMWEGAEGSVIYFLPTAPFVVNTNDRCFGVDGSPIGGGIVGIRQIAAGALAIGATSFIAQNAGDTSDLVKGDWLILAEYDAGAGDIVVTEWSQVSSVAGTTVTLQTPLRQAYPNARAFSGSLPLAGLTFAKVVPKTDLRFKDFQVIGLNMGSNNPLLVATWCRRLTFDNFTTSTANGQGMLVYKCSQVRMIVSANIQTGTNNAEFASIFELSIIGCNFGNEALPANALGGLANYYGLTLDFGTCFFSVFANQIGNSAIGSIYLQAVSEGSVIGNVSGWVRDNGLGGGSSGIVAVGARRVNCWGNTLVGGTGVGTGVGFSDTTGYTVNVVSSGNIIGPNNVHNFTVLTGSTRAGSTDVALGPNVLAATAWGIGADSAQVDFIGMTDQSPGHTRILKIGPGSGGAGQFGMYDQTGTKLFYSYNFANFLTSLIGGLSVPADIRRSRQTPTEAVLVSGVDATAGEIVSVTLTAARLVGAPLNLAIGQYLTFEFTEGGAGAFAVTWNAIFKKTWSDAGNATGKISSITYYYNGTNLVQTGAQAPYV